MIKNKIFGKRREAFSNYFIINDINLFFILARGRFNYQIDIVKGKIFVTNRNGKVPKLENESSKKGTITNFRRISIDCMAYNISLPNINLNVTIKTCHHFTFNEICGKEFGDVRREKSAKNSETLPILH